MLDVGCERESTPVDAPGVGGEDRQLGSGPAGDRERERETGLQHIVSLQQSVSAHSAGVSESVSSPVISL